MKMGNQLRVSPIDEPDQVGQKDTGLDVEFAK